MVRPRAFQIALLGSHHTSLESPAHLTSKGWIVLIIAPMPVRSPACCHVIVCTLTFRSHNFFSGFPVPIFLFTGRPPMRYADDLNASAFSLFELGLKMGKL